MSLSSAADSGFADPTQMKIGMVVCERCETGAELEAREAAMLSTPASVEFRDEDGFKSIFALCAAVNAARPG